MKDMIAVTHDGVFHADDVFAAAVLQQQFGSLTFVRTRDKDVIASADVVFDVGGVYDEESRRFDHHQRGGAGVRENGIPYAAFGLVWKRYGAGLSDRYIAEEVDRLLVQPIDAADNGVDLSTPIRDDVRSVSVSSAISMFNASWDEADDLNPHAFDIARGIAAHIIDRAIARARGTILARHVVSEAMSVAEDPRLIILPQFCPWQETIVESPHALYVVFESFGSWRVQCVPESLGSFGVRKPLPAAWAGLNGGELAILTGVADSTFAHKGLFIAGATSQDGALALAKIALNEDW